MLDLIDNEDVYDNEAKEFGKEGKSHITALYGIHKEVKSEDIIKVLEKYKTPIEIEITGLSSFKAKEYDVLKFDIKSETLSKINKDLLEFPNTNDFPVYHGHITLAYIKKGKIDKYLKKLSGVYKLKSSKFQYSEANGKKHDWKL